jgi:hypothetical protein
MRCWAAPVLALIMVATSAYSHQCSNPKAILVGEKPGELRKIEFIKF